MLKSPVPENDEPVSPAEDESSPKARRHRSRRRSSHTGLLVVLTMIVLILGHYGLRFWLLMNDWIHPITTGFVLHESASLTLAISILTSVGLLCLFLIYRGHRSIRFVFGAISAIAAVIYAVVLAIDLVSRFHVLWLGYDILALGSAIFASWTCLFSEAARRFLSNQPAAR